MRSSSSLDVEPKQLRRPSGWKRPGSSYLCR
jgi:hypothetical protein